jgi:hypothetical protein
LPRGNAKIAEYGAATRFSPGNTLAKLRGLNRRKAKHVELDEVSQQVIYRMLDAVLDPADPWHREYGPQFCIELLKVCTPRRRELAASLETSVETEIKNLLRRNSVESEPVELDAEIRQGNAAASQIGKGAGVLSARGKGASRGRSDDGQLPPQAA